MVSFSLASSDQKLNSRKRTKTEGNPILPPGSSVLGKHPVPPSGPTALWRPAVVAVGSAPPGAQLTRQGTHREGLWPRRG